MHAQIHRSVIDALGFDLDSEIDAFKAALAEHAETEGVPAPTSHPLVEQLVRSGASYTIVEPPPLPPTPTADASN